jgi:hypothetical protein
MCRLQARDSSEATIRIPLEDASKAKRTRVVYLCDYTRVREIVTFRRELNWNWETITRNHTDNPQFSSDRHLTLRYDPNNNYLAYDYDPATVTQSTVP